MVAATAESAAILVCEGGARSYPSSRSTSTPPAAPVELAITDVPKHHGHHLRLGRGHHFADGPSWASAHLPDLPRPSDPTRKELAHLGPSHRPCLCTRMTGADDAVGTPPRGGT